MENYKIYLIAFGVTVLVSISLLFFYKWYTKPNLNEYCGSYNSYSCEVGKCDFLVRYETGSVGYCRNTLFGL